MGNFDERQWGISASAINPPCRPPTTTGDRNDLNEGGAKIRDDTPPHPTGNDHHPMGPKLVKNNDQSGAKSGDHTHWADSWPPADTSVSAHGQFLLAADGHFHVRQWAGFHVRRQRTGLLTSA